MDGGPHLPGEGESARNEMVRYSHYCSILSFRSRAILPAGGDRATIPAAAPGRIFLMPMSANPL